MSRKSLLPFDRFTISIPFYNTKLNASKNHEVYDTLSAVNSFNTYISASGAIPGHSLFTLPATPAINVPWPTESVALLSWEKFMIFFTYRKSLSE